ncbi:MAG: alpha-glucuronidase [Oscillospiraceae bacterium]|jgi:alpha-glucuronidase|nr:alpha-glucuronidase [Oscillospiraceae bacterium]
MFKYRVINHWDNMDGSVERGYAGRSLFFKDGNIDYDAARVESYAAYLGKIGVNQISLNNVNVNARSAKLITDELLPDLAKLAAIFRKYGVQLLIAVEFSAPIGIGGLDTCDPLEPSVVAWWENQVKVVYEYIPDLAGFLVKADSEFRIGPMALGRTQADGANVLARALKPFGGIVYWRCFVYNAQQDWRDTVTDRARAAYDNFKPLDGQFDDNVILQIKNGPVDFQVREPISPLLGNMPNTREALELQITQEYTGQQIDLFASAVMWDEVLNSPVNERETLSDICGDRIEALVGVANAGDDAFLCGHPLAKANLYAFGALGQNPKADAKSILADWVRDEYGHDIPALTDMLLKSRSTFEKYCAPLGIGWFVQPGYHYGPSPDGYEFSQWGTYHKSTNTHIGVERGTAGTGFVSQYDPHLAKLYDDPATTPWELLLFFHRLPYTYVLPNGATIIQHIYNTRFEGAAEVEGFIATWQSLADQVPSDVYAEVTSRLNRQLENANEWRDVLNTYFHRKTGIPDAPGRKIYE